MVPMIVFIFIMSIMFHEKHVGEWTGEDKADC